VDKLSVPVGENIAIQKVMMISPDGAEVQIGSPYIEGAVIDGTVVKHAKERKVIVLKYKPKKRIRIKAGHRQEYTLLEIDRIRIGDTVLGKKEETEHKTRQKPAGKAKTEAEHDGEKETHAVEAEEKTAKKGARKAAEEEKPKAKKSTKKAENGEKEAKEKKPAKKGNNEKKSSKDKD
jgi:large subunit ribosomal protein L21